MEVGRHRQQEPVAPVGILLEQVGRVGQVGSYQAVLQKRRCVCVCVCVCACVCVPVLMIHIHRMKASQTKTGISMPKTTAGTFYSF